MRLHMMKNKKVEQVWQEYRKLTYPLATPPQVLQVVKEIFFAGATTMLNLFVEAATTHTDLCCQEDACVQLLDEIYKELADFQHGS